MKKNMATTDRILRLTLAVVLIVLFYTNVVSGTWGIISLVAAGVLTVVSLVGVCPFYSLFGVSTCKTPVRK